MQTRRLVTAFTFATTLALGAGTAFAQDDMTDGGEATDAAATADAAAPAMNSGAFSYKSGTLGINTTFPTGGNAAAADILYFTAPDTALDLSLGFNLAVTGDGVDAMGNPVEGGTTIGLAVGAGYRMYKPMSGKIRPYLEPGVALAIADFSAAGDTISLGAFAALGVELQVTEQFTLGTNVGAGLTFANSFETINLGLNTASITAGFYW